MTATTNEDHSSKPTEYVLDKEDQDLVFKSASNDTFHISTSRASLSFVFKQMIRTGSTPSKEPISLSETTPELLLFFKVLGVFGSETSYPSDLKNLSPSQLTSLLSLADKYGALSVGIFVQQEVLIMVNTGRIDYGKDLDTRQILLLFYYAGLLDLDPLLNIAAKMTFRIDDLVFDTPDDFEFITRKAHIKPLIQFRRRWEGIKKQILEGGILDLSSESYNAILLNPHLIEASSYVMMSQSTSSPEYYRASSPLNFSLTYHSPIRSSSSSSTTSSRGAKAIRLLAAFQSLNFDEKYMPAKE